MSDEVSIEELRRRVVHAFFSDWQGVCVHVDKGFGEYRQCEDPEATVPISALPTLAAAFSSVLEAADVDPGPG